MHSCDTFALTGACYTGGANILCKNSDRPLGECQPLRYFPRQSHEPGEKLQLTGQTIDQTEVTWAMLGSQPYWIWGFEMGVNEWGLAIGNEAEHSQFPAEEEEGILGMDLLRLALERSKTAREAIGVITHYLSLYGQNANASMLGQQRYENSFMLVDPKEIWVLETAGRMWVAKQVTDWAAISNCYSIGTDFDLCHPELEGYARENRWLAPDESFDFSKACSKTAGHMGTATRWRRMCQRISQLRTLDEAAIKSIERDHYEGEIIEPRFGGTYGGFTTICMHAPTPTGSQTAASLLAHWDDTLGVVGRYAPSLPCCSVYLPVYMTGKLPDAMTRGGERYDPESLWWRTEQLAMAISIDEERFGGPARAELRKLEEIIRDATEGTEACARALMAQGKTEEANALLDELTEQCVADMLRLTQHLTRDILDAVAALGGLYGPRKDFLKAYSQRTGLPIV